MRASSIVSLAVAIGLGGAAAVLSKGLLQGGAAGSVPAAPARMAVVAAQQLPFGTPLSPDNLKEIPWPSENIPEGAFSSVTDLLKEGRRLALTNIQKDEPVLSSRITGANQRATLSTLIDEGMRAVSVKVDEVRGVAGFILPGDRVDVVLTRGENANAADGNAGFADVLLQNTKVLAIDQLASDREDKPSVARAVTLEVNAEQAQKVILAQGVGRLSLVLRQTGATAPEPARRVMASELGEGNRTGAAQDKRQAAAVPQEETRKPLPEKANVPALLLAQPIVSVIRNAAKREQYTVRSEQ